MWRSHQDINERKLQYNLEWAKALIKFSASLPGSYCNNKYVVWMVYWLLCYRWRCQRFESKACLEHERARDTINWILWQDVKRIDWFEMKSQILRWFVLLFTHWLTWTTFSRINPTNTSGVTTWTFEFNKETHSNTAETFILHAWTGIRE